MRGEGERGMSLRIPYKRGGDGEGVWRRGRRDRYEGRKGERREGKEGYLCRLQPRNQYQPQLIL